MRGWAKIASKVLHPYQARVSSQSLEYAILILNSETQALFEGLLLFINFYENYKIQMKIKMMGTQEREKKDVGIEFVIFNRSKMAQIFILILKQI